MAGGLAGFFYKLVPLLDKASHATNKYLLSDRSMLGSLFWDILL
jgi:hypothetical protein